jgi:hypothetical protein
MAMFDLHVHPIDMQMNTIDVVLDHPKNTAS